MTSKIKKGVEPQEYPKLIKNENGKKVRVMNEMEEVQLNNVNSTKKEKANKGW